MRCGRPALGRMALPAPSIATSASRQPIGPAPQFTPSTSASTRTASERAATAGSVPSASTTSSPKVNRATIGRSAAAARASSTAIARWSTSENVSNQKASTPPSSRPSMVSRNAARTSASPRCRISRFGAPSGPIDPATSTSRPATSRASRAICAPRRASFPARSARPCGASRTRLAPNVAVSMMSAPTARYSRWIAPISSGRLATSSSRTARCGMPRLNSSVPIAPSASSGPVVSRSRNRARASPVVTRRLAGSGRASARPHRRARPCVSRSPRAGLAPIRPSPK